MSPTISVLEATAIPNLGPAMYERIVCLTEETTETLYMIGEDWRIVGISGYTVRPLRARQEKPRVSAFKSANGIVPGAKARTVNGRMERWKGQRAGKSSRMQD
jgi:ABC-type hemin transport system substrate-binding protein